MKGFFVVAILISALAARAQFERYPYIQSTNESSVIIAWRTSSSVTGSVSFGLTSGNLANVLTEPSATKKHAITITGLTSNTKYYYKASAGGSNSNVEHFYTAKTAADNSITFLHYGDCGYGLSSATQTGVGALMEQEDVDFAVVSGDVDQLVGDNYQDNYFAVYKNMLARDCHYTALGNHDIIANGGATYLDDFYLPHNNPDSSERYYSFTWGNAKFINMDSNLPYSSGSAQYNWLVNELKCNESHWLFVYFHHPPWTNAWDVTYYIPLQPFFLYQGNKDMRTTLVPLFEQYGVDYVLNGHAHCYQRGQQNGIYYVISGGAGAGTLDAHTNNNSQITVEKYVNQYVKFSIHGDTATFVSIDINGNTVDSLTQVKPSVPYTVNLTKTDESCFHSNDGSASISVTGENSPYTFAWSTGSSGSSVSGLNPGNYGLTITNKNGCPATKSVTVAAAQELVTSVTKNDASCTDNDGSLQVNISGGSAPYTVNWSSGQSGTGISGIPAGNYQVTVTDAKLCSKVDSAEILKPDLLKLHVTVFLKGPYNKDSLMMSDELRQAGYLPLQEPFTGLGFNQVYPGGGEQVLPVVFAQSGPNAIVDWIMVELRDKSDNGNIVATRSALLQRDGDVVDVDGMSNLVFQDMVCGNYFVSVRHRNHLGAMTQQAVYLDTTVTVLDFTSPSFSVFGSSALENVNGKMALWSGNVVKDGMVKFSGQDNDRDPILVKIGGAVPTNVLAGYYSEDVNLDGFVKYSGLNNDSDNILLEIGGTVPTAVVVEKLP